MGIKTTIITAVVAVLLMPLSANAEHEDSVDLSTITVEGRYGRPGTLELQPGSGGTLDTSELLKQVPGGAVNRNGPLTNLPAYRGMYGNQVNVMVDGFNVKEVGPNSMDTSLSNVPKSVVKSVKVYRGIAPVSSGIETLGGTIAVESKEGGFAQQGQIETHGQASGGYSWVNSGRNSGLTASMANDSHRAHVSGTYERGNDYKFSDDKSVTPSRYERFSFGAGYGAIIGDGELGIDYDHKDTQNAGTPSLPMDIKYVRSDILSTNYNTLLMDKYKLEVLGFYQDSSHAMDNYRMRSGNTGNNQKDSDSTVGAGGYRAALLVPEMLTGDLKVGVDGDFASHDQTIYKKGNATFTQNFRDAELGRYGIFAEWRGDLANKWNLELGVRYNRIEMDAGQVSTTMAMTAATLRNNFNAADRSKAYNNVDGVAVFRFEADQDLDFELGLASKTRAPTYQQRYLWLPMDASGGLADNRTYVGDLGLKSERSYEAEFTVDWHTTDFYLTPAVFYRYVDNYIQGLVSTDTTVNGAATMMGETNTPMKFSNISAELYGADLEAGYTLNDNLRLDGILSYVRGVRAGSSVPDNLYRIAPLNGRLKLTYERSGWIAYTELVGAAKQTSTASFNSEIATPGYALFNVHLQYQPSMGYIDGLTFATGVDNMLDKQYANHLNGVNRASNTNVDNDGTQQVPSPGRNVYVTANLAW